MLVKRGKKKAKGGNSKPRKKKAATAAVGITVSDGGTCVIPMQALDPPERIKPLRRGRIALKDTKQKRLLPDWPIAADNLHQYQFHQRTQPAKIAIIGKAPSSMMLAPYGDPTWEIWSINDSIYRNMIPRANRQFELHNIELCKQPGYDSYYPWICQVELPVFVNDDYKEIKNRIVYPRAEIVDAFPFFTLDDNRKLHRKGCTYYTNSISYLIALAVYELQGVERGSCIGLWGVDMAQHGKGLKSEYAAQRPSCELMIGWAMGRGIAVVIPPECDLLKTSCMYGFDSYGEMMKKLTVRENELDQRINQTNAIARQKHEEGIYLQGARDDVHYQKQWAHCVDAVMNHRGISLKEEAKKLNLLQEQTGGKA